MSLGQLQHFSLNRRYNQLWLAAIIALLLLIYMPLLAQGSGFVLLGGTSAWAQAPQEEGEETKPCSSCHSEETAAWQLSVHAAAAENGSAGATCTDCHGDYVRGHPDAGVIPLVVDSSNCSTCHTATHEQWEQSLHAGEGVQCIGCHKAHDQELRLTDDKLCSSCHLEATGDSLHSAHWQSEVACTSCHLTDTPTPPTTDLLAGITSSAATGVASEKAGGSANFKPLEGAEVFVAMARTPTHDFVTVSAAKCLDCHRNDVYDRDVSVESESPAQSASPAPELASMLQSAEKSNHFLTMLSGINLGFGIGIGGILGILFVLVVAAINQRSKA
jgi:hypothetical protein